MESKALFTPRKRDDLPALLDRINSLTNAMNFKREIETQIDLNNQKIELISKITLRDKIRKIFYPNIVKLERVNSEIESSKIRTQNENNEKMKMKFHTNELSLQDDLDEVMAEMYERFETYKSGLYKIYDQFRFGKKHPADFPMEDLKFLLNKYEAEPPKTNPEKLALYLTMEELLYRCEKAL